LFETDAAEQAMIAAGVVPDPTALRDGWDRTVATLLDRATLHRPKDGWMQTGGRHGVHSEHLGTMLAEMQVLQRTYPGARW
jgi:ring-1,2-phenylacetyl-CoA epoxidase subunit PaaC